MLPKRKIRDRTSPVQLIHAQYDQDAIDGIPRDRNANTTRFED